MSPAGTGISASIATIIHVTALVIIVVSAVTVAFSHRSSPRSSGHHQVTVTGHHSHARLPTTTVIHRGSPNGAVTAYAHGGGGGGGGEVGGRWGWGSGVKAGARRSVTTRQSNAAKVVWQAAGGGMAGRGARARACRCNRRSVRIEVSAAA